MNRDIMITEKNQDPTYTGNLNYFIYLTIGVIYVILLSLVVDRILDYDSVEKICNDTSNYIRKNSDIYDSDEYKQRQSICKKAKEDYDTKKFMYMTSIGILSIFAGVYMAHSDYRYLTGGYGVALGGTFATVYFTVYNWNTINKDAKLGILGLSFAILFYGSVRMYG
jgi:hypothetical protein